MAETVSGAELAVLGLLIGRENLQEGRLGFRIAERLLGRQITECRGSLLDPAGIVVLDGGIQSLARRLLARARAHGSGSRRGEDRCRLLLLGCGKGQKRSQMCHLPLREGRWIGRSMRRLSEHQGSCEYGRY